MLSVGEELLPGSGRSESSEDGHGRSLPAAAIKPHVSDPRLAVLAMACWDIFIPVSIPQVFLAIPQNLYCFHASPSYQLQRTTHYCSQNIPYPFIPLTLHILAPLPGELCPPFPTWGDLMF